MRPRTDRTQAEWDTLISEFERSGGMSQKTFCQQKGIAISSFARRWREYKRTTKTNNPPVPAFLPLHERYANEESAVYHIELAHGHAIRIQGTPDFGVLRSLIDILEVR